MKVPYQSYLPQQKLVEMGLTPSQILLAGVIGSFSKQDKPCIDSYKGLGESCNISSRTCQRDIAKLAILGLITIKSGSKTRNANQYFATKKLKALYGQNGYNNIAKMAKNNPSKEGYNTQGDAASLAKQHNLEKEYLDDVAGFNEDYAKARLKQRIKLKKVV